MTALPDFAEVSDLTDYRAGDDATLLRQAQGAIRRYCGWHIAPEVTETLTLDGRGGSHMWLPSLYVTDIVSVTNEGETVDLVDDLDWSANGFLWLRGGYWTERPRQVVVELTHGYGEIPDELIGVAAAWANRMSTSPAYKRETTGPFSVEAFDPGFLVPERDVLNEFKLPSRP